MAKAKEEKQAVMVTAYLKELNKDNATVQLEAVTDNLEDLKDDVVAEIHELEMVQIVTTEKLIKRLERELTKAQKTLSVAKASLCTGDYGDYVLNIKAGMKAVAGIDDNIATHKTTLAMYNAQLKFHKENLARFSK